MAFSSNESVRGKEDVAASCDCFLTFGAHLDPNGCKKAFRGQRVSGRTGGWGRAQRAPRDWLSPHINKPLDGNPIRANRRFAVIQLPSNNGPLPCFRFLAETISNWVYVNGADCVDQRAEADDTWIIATAGLSRLSGVVAALASDASQCRAIAPLVPSHPDN